MSIIDVVVVPTFAAADASPPTTLYCVDMKRTNLYALRRAIYSGLATHLPPRRINLEMNLAPTECDAAAPGQKCELQKGDGESGTAVDIADLLLLVGGVVVDQPDSTVLAGIPDVSAAVKTCVKRQLIAGSIEVLLFRTLTVHVSQRPAPYCITIQINVDRRSVPLFVSLPITATITELKGECAIAASMPEADAVLFPSPGEEPFTEQHRALSECGFENGTMVYLERRSQPPPQQIQIFVRTLTGKLITVMQNPHALVETLKADIQGQTDVPPKLMRLIFAGKQLEDGHCLSEYGVVAYAIVELVLRLRGNGHSGIPHSDSSLFFMTFTMRPNSTAVKIVDAIGVIPFVQNGVSITLARPCLGALHVWLSSGARRQKTHFVGGERVQLDHVAEPQVHCEHFTPTFRDVSLEVSGTEIDFRLDFDQCTTASEVLRAFFAQVAAELPKPIVDQGFNVFLVRPSGIEVLVDGIEPLLSPHNARKTLVVRTVSEGTPPAVTFSSDSDDSCPECPDRPSETYIP